MHGMNANYGHKAILASYANVTDAPPIRGALQHGWTPFDGWPWDFELRRGLRRLVWSSRALERERGVRAGRRGDYIVVGSPFAYLVEGGATRSPSRGSAAQSTGEGGSAAQSTGEGGGAARSTGEGGDVAGWSTAPSGAMETTGGTIAFPHHSAELGKDARGHDVYARELLEAEGHPITVCLFTLDYETTSVRAAYESAGHQVVTIGSGRNDRFYLAKWLRLVEDASRVVTDGLSTAALYAAALGLEVEVYGTPLIVDADARDTEAAASVLREFGAAGGAGLLVGREFARAELGFDELLPVDELKRVLGWTRAQLPVTYLLGSLAAIRRAR